MSDHADDRHPAIHHQPVPAAPDQAAPAGWYDNHEWEIQGQLTAASNATFLVRVGDREAVYKPVRGERPLSDFPDGTLARREVAAYQLSSAAGFDLVPPTVLARGPFGIGSVQNWIDDQGDPLVDVIDDDDDLSGWLPVMDALSPTHEPVWVVHRDDNRLRALALFDLVANNADRKGSHVLHSGKGSDGRVYGIDHGICFHALDKVRTILWGFAGEPFAAWQRELLRSSADVAGELSDLLSPVEVIALQNRVEQLLELGRYPEPSAHRYPFPWPPL